MYVAANLAQCHVLSALVMLSGGKTIYDKTSPAATNPTILSIHMHGWRETIFKRHNLRKQTIKTWND